MVLANPTQNPCCTHFIVVSGAQQCSGSAEVSNNTNVLG